MQFSASLKILQVFFLVFWFCSTSNAETSLKLSSTKIDTSSTISITSDSMILNQKKHETLFEGNVYFKYDKLELNSQKLKIVYTQQGSGTFKNFKFFATGAVSISNGVQKITGERAFFDNNSDKIIIEGNVILSQNQNTISGDNLTLYLKDGIAQMTGPVKTIFVPEGD